MAVLTMTPRAHYLHFADKEPETQRGGMTCQGHAVGCWAWPYQLEFAVDVELPPVQVIDVEGEVVVPTAAGVGENIPAALGKAQEDVSVAGEVECPGQGQPTACPATPLPGLSLTLHRESPHPRCSLGKRRPWVAASGRDEGRAAH